MTALLGRLLVITLVACSCAAVGPDALAQGLSDMRGTVVDSSGGGPSRRVDRHHQPGQRARYREVTSNADGSWYVPGLTPGTYQVPAELSGFKRFLRRDLPVTVGTTTTVPVSLDLGTLEETVDGDQRVAAHRRHVEADRWQPDHRRS